MRVNVDGSVLHTQMLGRVPVDAPDFQLPGIGHCVSSGVWMLRMSEQLKTRYPDQTSFDCATAFRRDYRIFYTVAENGAETDIQGEGAVSVFGGGFASEGLTSLIPVSASLSPIRKWTLHVALPSGLKNSETAQIVFRHAGDYSRFYQTISAKDVRFPSRL